MRHYCTYFDQRYLLQGLTLYRSLASLGVEFVLHVLCFDDPTLEILEKLGLANIRPGPLREFEAGDEALLAAKRNRSLVEYYFTCSPSWPLYLLNRFPGIDLVTYLDSDLFFYSSPEPVFEEMGSRSILIVGHRFPEELRHLEINGIYNVGLVAFRNDANGRECLSWWRERCLEWCYDRREGGRFADQKYLDDWPGRFRGVAVLRHKGAGLAPWNWMNYRIEMGNGTGTVDGEPLIFYHFQGVKLITRRMCDPGTRVYGKMPAPLRRRLYGGYLAALAQTERWLGGRIPGLAPVSQGICARDYGWKRWVAGLLRGQVMIVPGRPAP
jgi:hypothetical protein